MNAVNTIARPTASDYTGLGMARKSSQTGLEFRRIDGPFGIEVRGVRWEDANNPDVVAELTRAMRRHLLLVLRGQESPTHPQSNTFWSAFGPLVLNTVDGQFHYNKFSADKSQQTHRRADGNYLVATNEGMIELGWHNDQSHKPQFKKFSILEAMKFEKGAVPTGFRDMYTVFEMLPREIKAQLDGKQGIFFDPRLPGPEELTRLCDAMHPIISTHPDSGRRAIFGSDWTVARIAGMTADESTQMISYLRDFADANAPYYEHHWEEGDICVWDNFGVQHRREEQAPGVERVMRLFEGVAEG